MKRPAGRALAHRVSRLLLRSALAVGVVGREVACLDPAEGGSGQPEPPELLAVPSVAKEWYVPDPWFADLGVSRAIVNSLARR